MHGIHRKDLADGKAAAIPKDTRHMSSRHVLGIASRLCTQAPPFKTGSVIYSQLVHCIDRKELAAGEAAAAQGRAGVEAKLGALTNRLLHMARKEAKREKRRGMGSPPHMPLAHTPCDLAYFSLQLLSTCIACTVIAACSL